MRRSRPADGAWLEEHLAGCDACRSVAASYEADRLALRAMRDRQPEPPRDLWARTSAAIERESSARGGASRRATGSSRRPRPALGVLSGVAVIAVVIGATVLSGGFSQAPSTAIVPPASPPAVAIASTPATPDATPFAVPAAGSVRWVGTSANGALAYNVAKVDEVCPVEGRPDCPTVSDDDSRHVDISIRPKSISKSPGQRAGGRRRRGRQGRRRGVRDRAADRGRHRRRRPRSPTPKPTPASTPRPTATVEPSPSVEPVRLVERRRPLGHAGRDARGDAEADRRADARAHPGVDTGRHADTDLGDPDQPRDRQGRQGRRRIGRLFTGWRVVRLHRSSVEGRHRVRTSTCGGSATTSRGG